MLQVSFEVSTLTDAQRLSLSSFILTFPASNVVPQNNAEVDEVTTMSGFKTSDEEWSTPDKLRAQFAEEAEEAESQLTAEEAFIVAEAPLSTVQSITVAIPQVDKNGLPWNERIHASSRAINDDGSWRYKRGADKGLVAEVEAELKALMGFTTAPPPPPAVSTTQVVPPPPPPLSIGAQVISSAGNPVVLEMTLPPPPPALVEVPLGVPLPPPPVPINTFVALVKKVTAAKAAGTLTLERLQETVAVFGVKDFGALANHLDKVPAVEAALAL